MSAIGALWRQTDDRHLDLIAAGVAFYAMLAVFPAVAAVIALWGFVSDPRVVEEQLGLLQGVIPPEAFALLAGQVRALIATNDSALGLTTALSTGAAIWSARAGVGALLRGLNAIYGIERRGGFLHAVTALGFTGALVAVALLTLASLVGVPVVLAYLPLGAWTELALTLLRWGVALSVMLLGLGVVYRYGPNRPHRPPWISVGAVVALGLWAVASLGLTLYLRNFGSYNEVYGSIGAVIALLMWFFISAYAVLLGAAVNAQVERRGNG